VRYEIVFKATGSRKYRCLPQSLHVESRSQNNSLAMHECFGQSENATAARQTARRPPRMSWPNRQKKTIPPSVVIVPPLE
jgi:hypothetical protein